MSAPAEGKFVCSDGLGIFFRHWQPSGLARGVVVIVPGFNSHSGYYQWAADRLSAAGLAVFAVDLRGRGQSDGERFYIESFASYVEDVAGMVALAQTRVLEAPVFLLGHSAGGVVACLYALEHGAALGGLICESFAHELPAPGFALAVIKGLSHLAPHLDVLRLKNEDFSRDAEIVRAMNNDPLIEAEAEPVQTVAALVRADENLKRNFERIRLPLLILHGSEDKAAKPTGSQHLYEMAGSKDKTLKLYEGSFHDPLNDLDRETLIGDIVGWIVDRLGKADRQ